MTMNNSTPHLPADYDEQVRRTIPYYDAIHAETIDLVRSLDRPPQVWLDTGCGTGAMVKLALDRCLGRSSFWPTRPIACSMWPGSP